MRTAKDFAKQLVDRNIELMTKYNSSGFDATFIAKIIARDTINLLAKEILFEKATTKRQPILLQYYANVEKEIEAYEPN